MESKAAVQVGDRAIEMWSIPVPDHLGDDEALLRVEGSGMCGSDWEQYQGNLLPHYPVIDGHEVVGRIERIGPVAGERLKLAPGDRVALEGWLSCGHCIPCLTGRFKFCENGQVYGLTPTTVGCGLNGGYAEYIVMRPRTQAYRMADDLSVQDAVFYNPLGQGFDWAVRLAGTEVGDSILIMGPGQRGLAAVIAAKEAGAGTIIVAGRGLRPWKLDLAIELGATHVINTDQDDVAEAVRDITGGAMVDRALDTTPHATKPIEDALVALKSEKGTLGLSASKSGVVTDLVTHVVRRGLTVRGGKGATPWGKQQAVRVIGERKYDLSNLHTHTYQIDELDTAMRVLGGEVPGEEPLHITVTPN
jgi:threonine dehydrogenase-like Zn-dependent dehydrogenase